MDLRTSRQKKMILCSACDYEVRDSDEEEIVASVQSHAKRKHELDLSTDEVRPLVQEEIPTERGL